MEPIMPKMIDDYRIIEKIGQGGQERINTLGKHTTKYGNYVPKQLSNTEAGSNELEVLKKLASLHSENLVKCYNFMPASPKGSESNIIEMEFCSGGTLYDEIQSCKENNEKFPEIQILSWLIQIVNGLEAIHSQNIIHQGVRPKNILIGTEGVLKVADFGASRILSSTDEYSDDIEGSIPYLSPEALLQGSVSEMSDIWSLGVLAYELCCLHHPYYFKTVESMRLALQYQYYLPLSIPKEYSKDLVTIIKSMLQKKQTNRPKLPRLKKALQMAKAKNLCVLIKKYQKLGLTRTNLINLVDKIPSPYCLRFFLNQDPVDEGFFDEAHCCRRMIKNKEKISLLCFCKCGHHLEMSIGENKVNFSILKDGMIIERIGTEKNYETVLKKINTYFFNKNIY